MIDNSVPKTILIYGLGFVGIAALNVVGIWMDIVL